MTLHRRRGTWAKRERVKGRQVGKWTRAGRQVGKGTGAGRQVGKGNWVFYNFHSLSALALHTVVQYTIHASTSELGTLKLMVLPVDCAAMRQ